MTPVRVAPLRRHWPFGYIIFFYLLKGLLTFWFLVSVWYFGGFFVLVVSKLAGDRLMSPQLPKSCTFLYSCKLPTYFHKNLECLKCLSILFLFILDELWNSEICFQPLSLPVENVSAPALPFCVCLTLYRVQWGVGRTPELCRSNSVGHLTGLTTFKLCLLALEVMCCLFWQCPSNLAVYFVVDGCLSNRINVVSGVP